MRRRALAGQLDQLKAERNEAAKADGRMMKEKGALPADVVAQRKRLGERIGALEAELRSEEHTSELQSRLHLVCRLLLEKKKIDALEDTSRGRKKIGSLKR